jgi:hypothetical protein
MLFLYLGLFAAFMNRDAIQPGSALPQAQAPESNLTAFSNTATYLRAAMSCHLFHAKGAKIFKRVAHSAKQILLKNQS